MDYYLKANTKEELLEDLRNAGFQWYDYDEMGSNPTSREPKKGEVISIRGLGSCIYLEHLVQTPPEIDKEGNIITPPVMTETFHANVRMRNPYNFTTNFGKPSSPQFDWA